MSIGKKFVSMMVALVLVVGLWVSYPVGVKAQDVDLTVGVMPAMDAAPIFWAEENGLFEAEGINVKVEMFTNSTAQQSAAQANQLDVYMASLVEFLIARENNPDAGRITTATDGVFPVVTSPDYDDSRDVKIGLMEISVTNFIADLYLADYEMEKVFINELPLRIQMLLAGELDMAVLPEPMASNAEAQGLNKLLIGESDESPNVMVFNTVKLAEDAETVAAFHRAYNEAVMQMAGEEDAVRALMVERVGLDASIQDSIIVPDYQLTRLPSEEYVEGSRVWIEELLGSEMTVEYDALVVGDYVSAD